MVRVFAIAALPLAAAAAPRIELDLAGYQAQAYAPALKHVGVGCAKDASLCRHAAGMIRPGYSYVEKYSRSCPAGVADAATCALPNAHAYDHQDGSLIVTKTVKLMNLDGKKCMPTTANKFCKEQAVSYARRAEYAVEYDAMDGAGNQAEKLIFTLIVNDHEAPSITPANGLPAKSLESCDIDNLGQDAKDIARWNLPATAIANDNIDGLVSDEMKVTITSPRGTKQERTQKAAKTTPLGINTRVLGDWTIRYDAYDHAGFFGRNGENNHNSYTRVVTVQDTTAPSIYCKAKSCAYEPGRVNAQVRAKFGDNRVITVKTVEDCCHECEQQQFRRPVGTVVSNHAPACGYFSYDKVNSKCYLMSSGVSLKTAGVVEPSKDWATGYPIQCQVQNDHECGTKFVDAGARCIDMRDSYDVASKAISGSLLKPTSSAAQAPIAVGKLGIQTIQYNCADKQGLKAPQTTRYVNVVDTKAPTVTLVDAHTVETSAGVTTAAQIDTYLKGFRCADFANCDTAPKTAATWHEGSCDGAATTWDHKKVATFAIKYTCTDHAGHVGTACRILRNQDKTKPVIALNDAKHGDIVTVKAAATGTFVDAGATCFDFIDGQINENLTIKGQNIKLNRPGTYKITYDCTDSAGNGAGQLFKTVIVEDKECPRCVTNGKQVVNVEAGFKYTESGATCTDKVGLVDASNVVQTNLPAEAVGKVDTNQPGVYTVTYRAKDGAGNWNDGKNGCKGGNVDDQATVYTRTVNVEDTLKPVITLDYNSVPIHIGDASDTGHGGVSNPAGNPQANPYLNKGKKVKSLFMAEEASASVDGWMIGAAASAVAGLALLAASKRTVVTAVPV
jgi:hypothetical protein